MPSVRPTQESYRLGLILPTVPQGEHPPYMGTTKGSTAASLGRLCADAEAAGAGALWAVDHLFWPTSALECLTTLTVAATATSEAMLGTCVLQLPLRRPAAVARQASALQLLSGGRFVLGVGLGGHRGEYEAAGEDYDRRGAMLDRGIDDVRACWRGAVIGGPAEVGLSSAPGWHTDVERPQSYVQAPATDPVPVWVGGSSGAAIERAARVGDGWVPLFLGPAAYARALQRLAKRTAAYGRKAADVTPAVVALVSVGEDAAVAAATGTTWLSSLYGLPPKAFARHLVAGPAEKCAEQLAAYHDAGARHVAVMIAGRGALDQFAALAGSLGVPPKGVAAAADTAATDRLQGPAVHLPTARRRSEVPV